MRSVENAFKNTISNNNLNINIEVTNNLVSIKRADFLVLPGVGSFPDCKRGLEEINGLINTLKEEVIDKSKPFLGICVGMQLMVDYSLEKTETKGFSWLNGYLKKIDINGKDYLGRNYKSPHMGWNNLEIMDKKHPILKNISNYDQFYFVHSYYLITTKNEQILASTIYNHKIPAIIGKDNYIGVQFHPEKSGLVGQKIISNWLSL